MKTLSLYARIATKKSIAAKGFVEGTNYKDPDSIDINTLDDAIFMDRTNDLSFTIDNKLVVLIEHQSSINENMPLRCLMYMARVYEKIIDSKAIYKTRFGGSQHDFHRMELG